MVSWCQKCGFIHLAFGTSLLHLQPEQVRNFTKDINDEMERYDGLIPDNEKAFVYSTDSLHVNISLNYRELKTLSEMLTGALLLFDVYQIITPPSNKSGNSYQQ